MEYLIYLVVALSLALSTVKAFTCPHQCQCNWTTGSVQCRRQALTTVPQNLPHDIISLDLSYNNLDYIDQTHIHNYTQLRSLSLSHNQISVVANGTFSRTRSIQRIDLRSNDITSMHIHLPSSLLELDLSGNRITEFTVPPWLDKLNISWNRITNISALFRDDSLLTELDVSGNNISKISAYSFQYVPRLIRLMINWQPYLFHINHTSFNALTKLGHLEICNNRKFSFIHTQLLAHQSELTSLDLSNNNITSFYVETYQHLLKLTSLDIHGNPIICDCALKWLFKNTSIHIANEDRTICAKPETLKSTGLSDLSPSDLICMEPKIINYTQTAYFKIGSQAVLKCLYEGDPEPMVVWKLPNGHKFTYNNYLEDQWDNRPSKEAILDQIYHRNGEWQKVANKYQDDLGPDRILLLSNGDLFISYVQRSDAGPYQCSVISPAGNDTRTMTFLLNYTIIKDVTVASMIVGFSSAGIFFGFGLLVALIRYISRKCAERQRKRSRSIKKIIGHLDTYRSSQIDRLRDNYGGHVGKMKEHALNQMDKMRENYFTQIARIQLKCAQRMDHLRENYNTQMGKIKGYSNHQIEKIRENYNSQMIKIRDYGSTQLEKLRETYKLQHQYLMKVLEAMNIDNCRGMGDSDCVDANSVLFDGKFTLDNIDINLDTLTLAHLEPDQISSHNSLISEDFQTAISEPDGLSLTDLPMELSEMVTARVHRGATPPETHSEATQTAEEDLKETDVFVIEVDETGGAAPSSPSSSIINV